MDTSNNKLEKNNLSFDQIKAKIKSVKSTDWPDYPSSETGGVIPMSIASRFQNERQRLSSEFTKKWKEWRIQFLKDQELHPNEPFEVPELYRELNNPIRRFYKAPFNYLEKRLTPILGSFQTKALRIGVKVVAGGILALWITAYHLKYNHYTWEMTIGPRIVPFKPVVFPGDKRFPSVGKVEPHEFADYGFSKRTSHLNL